MLARGLRQRFDGGLVLRSLALRIEPGERVAVLGPNGAGKTTLLRLLATLLRPSEGTLLIFGLDPQRAGAAVRTRLGVVGHTTFLYPQLTAAENLRYYADLYDVPDPERRIGNMLDFVGLAGRTRAQVRSFSRGMQQRLALARALLPDPELLLLDEPDAGLDVRALELLPLVFAGEASRRDRTVVFTTHQVDRALALARRALILVAGRVVYDGPTAKLDGADVAALYGAVRTGTDGG